MRYCLGMNQEPVPTIADWLRPKLNQFLTQAHQDEPLRRWWLQLPEPLGPVEPLKLRPQPPLELQMAHRPELLPAENWDAPFSERYRPPLPIPATLPDQDSQMLLGSAQPLRGPVGLTFEEFRQLARKYVEVWGPWPLHGSRP